jgi:hypothetical protein
MDDASIPASIDIPEATSVEVMDGVEISDYVTMSESPAAASSQPPAMRSAAKKGFWRRPFGRMV